MPARVLPGRRRSRCAGAAGGGEQLQLGAEPLGAALVQHVTQHQDLGGADTGDEDHQYPEEPHEQPAPHRHRWPTKLRPLLRRCRAAARGDRCGVMAQASRR